MIDLGTVKPGSTIRIPFSSFDKDDGSSITMTNYAVADILIYKDGSTTERASTAGFTATTDFDTKTGKHLCIINLADNTTAGFFAAGSEYLVAIDAVTIDAVTTGGWIARFTIGYRNAIFESVINTVNSLVSFDLSSGPSEDDVFNGMWCVIHDVASSTQFSYNIISDYVGSTKTITLTANPVFTVTAADNISIMGYIPLQPTVMGRTLDVSADGDAEANVTKYGGTAGTFSSGRPEVNTSHWGGTAVGSANVRSNLEQIKGSSLGAEGAGGQMATAMSTFLNVASPVFTAESVNQTGNSYTRLGAPIGASISADIQTVDTVVDGIAADHPNRPTRNTTLNNFVFLMVDSTDFNTPETGLTITSEVSKDGGAFSATSNSVTEMSSGLYKINITSTEMDANVVVLKFTAAGAAQRTVIIYTQPT